jgi:hypothetical protein
MSQQHVLGLKALMALSLSGQTSCLLAWHWPLKAFSPTNDEKPHMRDRHSWYINRFKATTLI